MRSGWSLLIVVALALTAGRARALDFPCGAGPDFEILSTTGNFNYAAFGVARNGEAIGAAAESGVAYAWDAAGNRRSLPVPNPPGRSYNGAIDRLVPVAISDDGSSIVGIFQPAFPDLSEVVLWQGGTVLQLGIRPTWRNPPSGPIYQWGAPLLGITEDGFKIVGSTFFAEPGTSSLDAYEWFPGAGVVRLPTPLAGGNQGTAAGISGDGRVIVGGERVGIAVQWVDGVLGSLAQGCGDPTVNRSGALAASRDGSVIVGWSTSNDCSTQVPTVWKNGTRLEIPLASVQPTHGGGNAQKANGVSADGRLVVGQDGSGSFGGFFGGKAFLWDEANGTRDLKELLSTHYGLGDLVAGWDLVDASDVSVDDVGRIRIVGVARSSSGLGTFEPFRATIPCLDDDRDGLCNEWEREGYIDVDGDGVKSLTNDLILEGADPRRMNIYVEVDYIADTNYSLLALRDVEAQFAKVPNSKIGNPNGRAGIILRLEADEFTLPAPFPKYSLGDDCGMPPELDGLKALHFGTPAQRARPGIVSLKAKLYRYLVVGGEHPLGWSGEASWFGPDAIVTLADFTPADGTREMQAGTIMHELGHTFGLGHGGASGGVPNHDNYKPNYHSVMSYTWQFRGLVTTSTSLAGRLAYAFSWVLDYSRHAFHPLDENGLDETLGIGGPPSHGLHFVPVSPTPARVEIERGAVDFDRNGKATDVATSENVNDVNPKEADATLSVLPPSDDWTYLADRYCENFRHVNWTRRPSAASCEGSGGATNPEESLVEMSAADIAALSQDYAVDCNGNGVDDQSELDQGLEVDANANGLLDSCEPLEGDCNDDSVVDDLDRDVLVESFGRLDGEPEYRFCADLDRDQQVTFVDYQLWRGARERYEQTLAPGALSDQPACGLIGLELAPLLAFGCRRRRRDQRRNPRRRDR